ncbi:MAG: hypothetical protein FWF52_04260 [Candidatus Azobacteroides sp.]|nr:hypothetical protein [Candidatus Azobacteroides sp.]
MPIKQKTPMQTLRNHLERQLKRKEEVILRRLSSIGEECVNHVKSLPQPSFPVMKPHLIPPHTPHFIDWSSNLRNSVGYVITVDGNIRDISRFSGEGGKKGEAFAREVAGKFPTGICLILVAGEVYASSVAAKGYDVLDSAEDLTVRLVTELKKKLASQ